MKASAIHGAALLAGLATGLASCAEQEDVYSLVASHCLERDPLMGEYIPNREDRIKTYLSDDCKAALEAHLPLNKESFDKAPEGMLDKVLEAFQAIIAYPLKVDPSSLILGTRPEIGGAIHADFYRIYEEWPNPNQAIFNYALNHIDEIRYSEDSGDAVASYDFLNLSSKPRKMTIYKPFWDLSELGERYRYPFDRAATLLHEAHHVSILHSACKPTENGSGASGGCDGDKKGSYVFETAYHKFLLHGSATCDTPGCTPPLSPYAATMSGRYMCKALRLHYTHRWPTLDALVGAEAQPFDPLLGNFCNSLTYSWIMEHEGLPFSPTRTGDEDLLGSPVVDHPCPVTGH